MRTVSYEEIQRHVTLESVIDPVREAFRSYSQGRGNVPQVQHLEMPDRGNSALHIKSGHVRPHDFCLVKVASTFPNNSALTPPKPSINGVIVLFSATDGEPIALLEDRAWITQARTAGAGGVATELFVRENARVLGVIGTGVQARLQARAVLRARPQIDTLCVWGRTRANVDRYVSDMRGCTTHLRVQAAELESVVRGSDVLVTATYSQEPLVRSAWLPPGVVVIAMGADSQHKAELALDAVADADLVVVDSRSQNEVLGEIGRGIRSGVFGPARIDAEIGEVLLRLEAQPTTRARPSAAARIICKLTGVAVQEILVCNDLLRKLSAEESSRKDGTHA